MEVEPNDGMWYNSGYNRYNKKEEVKSKFRDRGTSGVGRTICIRLTLSKLYQGVVYYIPYIIPYIALIVYLET